MNKIFVLLLGAFWSTIVLSGTFYALGTIMELAHEIDRRSWKPRDSYEAEEMEYKVFNTQMSFVPGGKMIVKSINRDLLQKCHNISTAQQQAADAD